VIDLDEQINFDEETLRNHVIECARIWRGARDKREILMFRSRRVEAERQLGEAERKLVQALDRLRQNET